MSAGITGAIDACAHPFPARADTLRAHMAKPWSARPFPGPEQYGYASFASPYVEASRTPDGIAGSDREAMLSLLGDAGVGAAILVPYTRGLHPNVDFGTAIASATNRWMNRWPPSATAASCNRAWCWKPAPIRWWCICAAAVRWKSAAPG